MHVLDGRFEKRVLVPPFFGCDYISLSIILGVNNDSIPRIFAWKNFDLDFRVRINANIEDPSMACEPGIRPAAVIADADGGNAVDNKKGFGHD